MLAPLPFPRVGPPALEALAEPKGAADPDASIALGNIRRRCSSHVARRCCGLMSSTGAIPLASPGQTPITHDAKNGSRRAASNLDRNSRVRSDDLHQSHGIGRSRHRRSQPDGRSYDTGTGSTALVADRRIDVQAAGAVGGTHLYDIWIDLPIAWLMDQRSVIPGPLR